MKTLLCCFLAVVEGLAMQKNPQVQARTQKLTPESTIVVASSGESAFRTIVSTAVANHLPLGIVIDDDYAVCKANVPGGKSESLAQFVDDLNTSMPRYIAKYSGGVLNVFPRKMKPQTEEFLRINIPKFQSEPDSHEGLGVSLWMNIRAVIAPKELTIFSGASSTTRETVTGMSVQNQNVETLLNAIVSKSEGGIWILRSKEIKDLSPSTPRPYVLKGYTGEEPTILGLGCQ